MQLFFLVLMSILGFPLMGNAGPGLCSVSVAPPLYADTKNVPCSMDVNGNIRFTEGTTHAGEDVPNDVQKVVQAFTYTNITLAAPTTTFIKSSNGILHAIVINKSVASGVITCYDNIAASGNVIATITQPAVLLQSFVPLTYNAQFLVGLTCVTSGATQDITVSWR